MLVPQDEPVTGQDESSRYRILSGLMGYTYFHKAEDANPEDPPEELPITLILSTHSVDYSSMFDYVAYMMHGRIVEFGSHTQLMQGNTKYRAYSERTKVHPIRPFATGICPSTRAILLCGSSRLLERRLYVCLVSVSCIYTTY